MGNYGKKTRCAGCGCPPAVERSPRLLFFLEEAFALDESRVILDGYSSKVYGTELVKQFFDCFKPAALSSITAVIYHDLGGTYRFLCYDGEHRIIIGHVSTAIITKSGLISADPTYFGSKAGQIIPKYENKKASIIKIKDML